MTAIPFQPAGNDSNDTRPLRNAVLASHAMADFLLADNAALTAFAAFMGKDLAEMQERVDAAHDVLVLMSAQLLFSTFLGGLVGDSDDEEDDSGAIRMFKPPF